MINVFVLIVVVLFSLKAFSNDENHLTENKKIKNNLEEKQIQLIKSSIKSAKLTTTKNQTKTIKPYKF